MWLTHDAEDLVQETFVTSLKRPRLVRGDTDIGYLVRALKNTHASWYRGTARQRSERPLLDEDGSEPAASTVSSREPDGGDRRCPGAVPRCREQLQSLRADAVAPDVEVHVATLESILAHGAQHSTVYLPSHDPESAARLAEGTIVSVEQVTPHGRRGNDQALLGVGPGR